MPKSIPAPIIAQMDAVSKRPVLLFELGLSSTIRFAAYKTSITFPTGGNVYTAKTIEIGNVSQSIEGQIQRINVKFDNVKKDMMAYAHTQDFRGKSLIIKRIYLEDYYTLHLFDSGLNEANGYLGAVGTGLTEVNAYTSDFTIDEDGNTGSKITLTGNIDAEGRTDILRGVLTDDNGTHLIYRTFTAAQLYRVKFDYFIPAANSHLDGVGITSAVAQYIGLSEVTGTWTSVDVYMVSYNAAVSPSLMPTDGGSASFADPGGDDIIYIDNYIVDTVTECAATGLHITDGYNNRNWASIDGGFDYNDDFTYEIRDKDGVVVASGSITQANAKFSFVNGASFACFDVDISAYAGSDLFTMGDSSYYNEVFNGHMERPSEISRHWLTVPCTIGKPLNRKALPFQYQKMCPWIFGGTECNTDGLADLTSLTAAGTADNGTTTTLVDDALTEVDDYWNCGEIEITKAGVTYYRKVKDFDAGSDTITLDVAMPFAIDNACTYVVYKGCDQVWETCNADNAWGPSGDNKANFGGCIHISKKADSG